MTKNNIHPFLRWAGSKRQLIPVLSRYWESQYCRYVEPFVGSGSLFFSLSPPQAVLGDINSELMSTYKQVKNNVEAVHLALKTMRKGRQNYLRLRAINPLILPPIIRAARFIYLNRFCFNGLYRTNSTGQFNVPYGGKKSGSIPSQKVLAQCSACLRKAELAVGSFEVTLEKVRPGDFVYMDPPFSIKGKRVFNEYDASAFGSKDLQRLRQWMIKLDRNDVHFLVSYAESEEADFLRDGFYTEVATVKRNIAGFAAKRLSAKEFLISNRRPKN